MALKYELYCIYAEMILVDSAPGPGIELHCAYYFDMNADADLLEKIFLQKKELTPETSWLKSQGGYFDLKNCLIHRPPMGGVAVVWRFPHTIKGYDERYEWIKDALRQAYVQ